jgi:hypothetical protein
MITNVIIFIAFAIYCLYTTIFKKIKYIRNYKELLFIGKINNYKYLPTSTLFRVCLSAVLVVFMFGFFKDNTAFLIAIVLTWVLATAFQGIDLKKDWKRIYLYKDRIVIGDKEYKNEYSMKKQKDGEKHYKIGFNDIVYDVNITDIVNATQDMKSKINLE